MHIQIDLMGDDYAVVDARMTCPACGKEFAVVDCACYEDLTYERTDPDDSFGYYVGYEIICKSCGAVFVIKSIDAVTGVPDWEVRK